MKKIFLSFVLFISASLSFGQDAKLSEVVKRGVCGIDSLVAVARVEFMSCDALEGRLTGSKDAEIVSKYIASEFVRAGYNPHFQEFRARGVKMRNVYTVIEGDSNEIVVVGAHYDHLGVDSLGDAYNGADDNASGVAAVLGIADAIKSSGVKPKRTIILALWDGEENGLNGSKHFVAHFPKIKNVVFYMNFDMIGRNTDQNRPNLFRYFYNDTKPQYKQFLDESITQFDLKLEPDYRAWDMPTSGSDNASFARAGIPITWYHTDGHADYHKVGDTHDKLNWAKLIDIIKSSYYVTWRVANL